MHYTAYSTYRYVVYAVTAVYAADEAWIVYTVRRVYMRSFTVFCTICMHCGTQNSRIPYKTIQIATTGGSS